MEHSASAGWIKKNVSGPDKVRMVLNFYYAFTGLDCHGNFKIIKQPRIEIHWSLEPGKTPEKLIRHWCKCTWKNLLFVGILLATDEKARIRIPLDPVCKWSKTVDDPGFVDDSIGIVLLLLRFLILYPHMVHDSLDPLADPDLVTTPTHPPYKWLWIRTKMSRIHNTDLTLTKILTLWLNLSL
jgi:hypothetical protein